MAENKHNRTELLNKLAHENNSQSARINRAILIHQGGEVQSNRGGVKIEGKIREKRLTENHQRKIITKWNEEKNS